jgi:hypothetical protein
MLKLNEKKMLDTCPCRKRTLSSPYPHCVISAESCVDGKKEDDYQVPYDCFARHLLWAIEDKKRKKFKRIVRDVIEYLKIETLALMRRL